MAIELTKVELLAKLHERGVQADNSFTKKELQALLDEAESKDTLNPPGKGELADEDKKRILDEEAKRDEAIIAAAKKAEANKALEPREVRQLTVVLPNKTKRVYSEKTHGAVWKTLANNYKEAWDGKFV